MQSTVPNRGKDPVAKGGMMLVRLGFLVALVLGLGMLTDTFQTRGCGMATCSPVSSC